MAMSRRLSSLHLRKLFAALPDPRRRPSRIRYPLLSLIVIALCAAISGANTSEEFALFAHTHRAWLAELVELPEDPNECPSHDTFDRVLSALDPLAFQVKWPAGHGRCRVARERARSHRHRRQGGSRGHGAGGRSRAADASSRRLGPAQIICCWGGRATSAGRPRCRRSIGDRCSRRRLCGRSPLQPQGPSPAGIATRTARSTDIICCGPSVSVCENGMRTAIMNTLLFRDDRRSFLVACPAVPALAEPVDLQSPTKKWLSMTDDESSHSPEGERPMATEKSNGTVAQGSVDEEDLDPLAEAESLREAIVEVGRRTSRLIASLRQLASPHSAEQRMGQACASFASGPRRRHD